MHTHLSHHTSLHWQRWLLHAITALGIAFFSLIGFTPAVYASGNPGGNVSDPVVRAVDIARPAVVRIITNINSQLIVKFSPKRSVTFPLGGGSYTLMESGSGAFISAHGDILTADHVVNPPHDDQMIQYFYQVASSDVADYINKHIPSAGPVTQDNVGQELTSGQLTSTLRYGKTQSLVYLSTDYTGQLTATSLQKVSARFQAPVDRIEAQSAIDKKDVAIVHVNLNDMASIQLGDSSSVHEQDMLTIIGFPGNGDVSMLPTNLLTSSVNQIIVSSIKTTDQGAQVIQVGGNVEHGDSGGPALDSNGNVVGIVSFSLSDQGSTNFLQASNSARALVQSLHLDMTPGPFEKSWSQAFNDLAVTTPGHWHKALQELTAIHGSYPLFQAIMPYLQYAQSQAQHERVQQSKTASSSHAHPQAVSPLLWTLLIIGVLVILALCALIVRRRAKQVRTATLPSVSLPQKLPSQQNTDGMVIFDAPSMKQRIKKGPLTPVILRPLFPAETLRAQQNTDAMVAFGAPSTSQSEQIWIESPTTGPLTGASASTPIPSTSLRPELDQRNPRFYSMWGGPVPQESIMSGELEATPTLDQKD